MPDLRRYRISGTVISPARGAVTALRSRAAAWDMPLIEGGGTTSLFILDGELRLTDYPDQMRVDLFAPDRHRVGQLRDSATELFADAGTTVRWDRVDVGMPAPGLSLMRVASVVQRSPAFLRVRLSAPDAGRFGMGGLHFRLLLPPAGREPVWPRVAATGRTEWPDGADRLHRPVYTVADHGNGWLDFDIFLHMHSPTCAWALSGPVGATIGIIGPGGGWCPLAERLYLFGDEAALPAIVRILALSRARTTAHVAVSADDLGDLSRDMRVTRCNDLMAALTRADPQPGSAVWFSAEADQARAARRHLLERGLDPRAVTTAGYWTKGRA